MFCKFTHTIAVVLALLAIPVHAEVAVIEGVDDDQFQELLTVWLSGKGEVALHGMAELANDDNLAAQIFIGQTSDAHISGHIFETLDRHARHAITHKDDGSLFGKRWLRVAAKRHPLAKALIELSSIETMDAAFAYLQTHDEHYRMASTLGILLFQGYFDAVFTAAENGWVEKISEFSVFSSIAVLTFQGEPTKEMQIRIERLYPNLNLTESTPEFAEFAMWGRPVGSFGGKNLMGYPESLLADRDLYERLENYTVNDERMEAARFLCNHVCPESLPTCGSALKAHQFAYTRYWERNYSPVEALVSTERYRASDRFVLDMRRLLLQTKQAPEAIRPIDACFADFLTLEP